MITSLYEQPQLQALVEQQLESLLRGRPLTWDARSNTMRYAMETWDLSNDCALNVTIKVMKKLGGGKGGLERT